MTRKLTIVMYHYVRQLEESRYPAIKGLRTSDFRGQLSYLRKNYTPVTMQEVVHSVRSADALPDNAVLLTFDDGYIDHYTTVFPILFDLGLQGSFFAPVATAERGDLLDVNRVHFILASGNASELADEVDMHVRRLADSCQLEPVDAYRRKWAKPNRFDTGEAIYVKRMLQHVLPEELRHEIARELFARHVTIDEQAFAHELYLNVEHLRVMQRCGMYVGSHGDSHYWLTTIDADRRIREIENSLRFLRQVGSPVDDFWVMCYPYGAHDKELLGTLRSYNCSVGLTTEVSVADLAVNDPLLLPRLDTNDIPTK